MRSSSIAVDLVLAPTEPQLEEINAIVQQIESACAWLHENAPPGEVHFKNLHEFCYRHFRTQGLYSAFIQRVVGKVIAHRKRGRSFNANYILYDYRMFSYRDGVLELRLLKNGKRGPTGGREVLAHTVDASENIQRQIPNYSVQSGVLQKCDDGRIIFKLKLFITGMISYTPSPIP